VVSDRDVLGQRISWNVAPTQPVYAVATSSQGARKFRALRWGLVPSWAKDPRIGSKADQRPVRDADGAAGLRSLTSSRRALPPISGFQEWRGS
jgi:putative SOS response-associated peptidase YedK